MYPPAPVLPPAPVAGFGCFLSSSEGTKRFSAWRFSSATGRSTPRWGAWPFTTTTGRCEAEQSKRRRPRRARAFAFFLLLKLMFWSRWGDLFVFLRFGIGVCMCVFYCCWRQCVAWSAWCAPAGQYGVYQGDFFFCFAELVLLLILYCSRWTTV